MDSKIKIGSIVKIILNSGYCINGAIRKWPEDDSSVIIANPLGDTIEILSKSSIAAVSFKTKDKDQDEPIEERNPKDEQPQHKSTDVKTLVELRRIKAEDELKNIRQKMKSPHPSSEPVEYADVYSILRSIKNNTNK